MDFFRSQDQARRNTGRLIFLFVAAVLSLIVITNVLVLVALGATDPSFISSATFLPTFLGISAVIIAVVLLGSVYKMSALAGGGARVAEGLNGRLLVTGSKDFHERRILNVVEEMALASGTPVPPVYLIEEEGINAFAAGYAPEDAVIGITRGAINSLNRDELQGVIAHEFSHILNGDMRINIRLIAVLHGILILGMLGRILLRSGAHSRRSRDKGGIVFLGLGLLVVGYAGIFFGNLIKAAVSRQREYLADASSVQFTRNPEGIGKALMRIATHSQRSYLNNPKGEEISHALFEEGSKSRLTSLFATHPPLEDRIRAVMPNWDGRYDLPPLTKPDNSEDRSHAEQTASRQEKAKAILTGVAGVLITDALIDAAGQPNAQKVETARQILQEIPQNLLDAAHEPAGARAIIYLLVLDRDKVLQQQQLALLKAGADLGVYDEAVKLLTTVQALDASFRLSLINIALGTLRQLTQRQYQLFRDNLDKLITADKKISPFEWALQRIVARQLETVFEKKAPARFGKSDIGSLTAQCNVLLSFLALAGNNNMADAEASLAAAADKLGVKGMRLLSQQELSIRQINGALDSLNRMKPLQKPLLLKACAACISNNNEASAEEIELFRAIADTLDCPMPPLG